MCYPVGDVSRIVCVIVLCGAEGCTPADSMARRGSETSKEFANIVGI